MTFTPKGTTGGEGFPTSARDGIGVTSEAAQVEAGALGHGMV